ncbi:hypothetical protein CCHR01_19442 [Colletotrichum chrysophilum]|uniref:Uncharacterized protein n=1 Tax=Colletotrichum chrysophilum TaxID=1836956 RepID=A0AAD8ZY96_9PEZI|nr:hypothetical protein CCHR01_19442 [Colletotrichum chrysophilum]
MRPEFISWNLNGIHQLSFKLSVELSGWVRSDK